MRIEALDANLWNYLTDENMARSGIDAGAGVFGGLSSAVVTW